MRTKPRRILLIAPPFYRLFKNTYSQYYFPLGLGYLAGAILMDTTWEVKVYNSDFSVCGGRPNIRYLVGPGFHNYLKHLRDPGAPIWHEIRSVIAQYRPTVVGVTATSPAFASACVVAKLAKEIDPGIITMVGGPHPSMVQEEALTCSNFTVAAVGEAESTVVEVLKAIEADRSLNNIPGILYRWEDRIIRNEPRRPIADLDRLSFPNEVAVKVLQDYHRHPVRAFRSVLATRGCPYNCLFCGSREVWGRHHRCRSVVSVVKEIQRLRLRGLRFVHFTDDTFGVNRRYLENLCHALRMHCPGLTWSCETHVKLVNEDTVRLMKAAGCHLISIGIESGNNEILRQVRKNITAEQALAACETIRKCGIRVNAFIQVGFPQETEETLADTIALMKKIKCSRLTYSVFTPYPGTEAYEVCRQRGLIGDSFDASLYNHHSPMNCFTSEIPQERFRQLASRIERMVVRKNFFNRMKDLFSIYGLRRACEEGWRSAWSEFGRILLGD